MRSRTIVALLTAVAVAAVAPACAKKNEDKLALQRLLQRSDHLAGVFRYSDETPKTVFASGGSAQVRGLVEDDFRYKARLTVDGADVLDEVVNDDALAVRFLDPSFIPKFTGSGGDPNTLGFLGARYWVADPKGAPSIGDAAVNDKTIGLDPIVDALSVIDYAEDAVAAAFGVHKYNPEKLDYRPLEDPFPQPQKGSGVTRWDIDPPFLPRADALDSGGGTANLARVQNFRQLAVYVKDGQILQIREFIGARYDLLEQFKNYIDLLLEKAGGKENLALKEQIDEVKDEPAILEALLNFVLNLALTQSGEDPVRFRSMKYEFSRQAEAPHADIPAGSDVKLGALSFFGVNSKTNAQAQAQRPGGSPTTSTTTPNDFSTSTSTTVP